MSLEQRAHGTSSKNLIILAVIACFVVTIVWYFFFSDAATDASANDGSRPGPGRNWDQPAIVISHAVEFGDLEVPIRSIGTVTPLNTITVNSRVDGVLDRVAFEEGTLVEKGTLLAEIDPRPYEAQLEEAEGTLQQNLARLENARADLKLYERLWDQDSIARQVLSDQQALVGELEGTVRANKAAVVDARLQLSWTRIEAPIDGYLGLRMIDPGNLVTSGSGDGLVTITQMQPIAVNFTVPERDVSALRKAYQGSDNLKVEVLDRNETEILATGTLKTFNNQIDLATGTLTVRASFDNEDLALFPNQFVNVRLRLKTIQSALVIPTDAVQYGNNRTYVYVIEDGKSYSRQITLGESSYEKIAVVDGLEPGERVALEGLDRLREGRDVVDQAPDIRIGQSESDTPEPERPSGSNRGERPASAAANPS